MNTCVVGLRRHCIALGLLLMGAGACLAGLPASAQTRAQPASAAAKTKADQAAQAALAAQRTAGPLTLLVVGDSLSAEYGLRRGTGWVALLDHEFQRNARQARVVNASISGDTTAGGVSRLPQLLELHKPTHLIIELGGNDALRGLPLASTEANLNTMARAGRAAGAKVMIVGLQMPPNYGTQYVSDFSAMFQRVAGNAAAVLVPSLLAGVADDPEPLRWFQQDRIHPVEAAQPRMLENVWLVLRSWL